MLQFLLGFCEIPSWNILYKNSYPRDFVGKCIEEFFDRVLTPKIVARARPKKDLMIVLPYLAKLSLQSLTRINCVLENKLPYCNLRIACQIRASWLIFSDLKVKFMFSYVLTLFLDLSVVDAIPPIIGKLCAIFKSECPNTSEFLHLLARKLKGIRILP